MNDTRMLNNLYQKAHNRSYKNSTPNKPSDSTHVYLTLFFLKDILQTSAYNATGYFRQKNVLQERIYANTRWTGVR